MKLLTQEEVAALPEGSDVFILWPDENTPRRYQVTRCAAGLGGKRNSSEPLAAQNGNVVRRLVNVGPRPGVEVWLPWREAELRKPPHQRREL